MTGCAAAATGTLIMGTNLVGLGGRMRSKGFTIVELLIVIVIVSILAAITVISYNGVQQRAFNSSVISSARNTITLIKAYQSAYGSYPSLGGYCTTTDNVCVNWAQTVVTSDNTSWLSELRKVGSPISSVPAVDSTRSGLYFDGYAPRTFNHDAIHGLLMYWLKGSNQNCGLSNVAMSDPSPLPGEANAYITSTSQWTGTGSGWTKCWISV